MRRVNGKESDVFKPKGQLGKELCLAKESTRDVIRILGERLSSERKMRIDEVVANRMRKVTVAIEGVIDPHNTAAIIRTAEAFGMQTVHVIEKKDKFLSSRRVTQGTHKWIDLAVWKKIDDFVKVMKSENKKILVADANATLSLDELSKEEHLSLIFGNEHAGISPEMKEAADGSFSIPMTGFAESFNVSVAAAITISNVCSKRKGDLSKKDLEILKARFYLRAIRAGYDIVKREMNY